MPHRPDPAMAHRHGRRGLILILTLAAAVCGVIAVVIAVRSQQSAPTPPTSAAGTVTTTPLTGPSTASSGHARQGTGSGRRAATGPVPVAASVPTFIDMPAIGVHSAVISIGKAADGTLAVPQPGPDLDKAAWYDKSVTPGQDGPSVIEGHVDSVAGPSVFYRLGALRPGDTVKVTRTDSTVAVFTVNGIRSYPTHAAFPTTAVYGSDLNHPTLRLITCSNFDTATGHYIGNTVVYATLKHLHRPG